MKMDKYSKTTYAYTCNGVVYLEKPEDENVSRFDNDLRKMKELYEEKVSNSAYAK